MRQVSHFGGDAKSSPALDKRRQSCDFLSLFLAYDSDIAAFGGILLNRKKTDSLIHHCAIRQSLKVSQTIDAFLASQPTHEP
jgi:hypothetical protein